MFSIDELMPKCEYNVGPERHLYSTTYGGVWQSMSSEGDIPILGEAHGHATMIIKRRNLAGLFYLLLPERTISANIRGTRPHSSKERVLYTEL